MTESLMFAGLGLILVAVLVLPFASRKVEHNLEAFLFVMGLGASALSGELGWHLAGTALREPILISAAVLGFGLLFRAFQNQVHAGISAILRVVSPPVFAFALVAVLGLVSSVTTAIIAALVLVEVIGALKLDRKTEVGLVVFACYAIGLGAALTPVGEPLATIAVSKLGESFWYLFRLLWLYVVPGVLAVAGVASFYVRRMDHSTTGFYREAAAPANGAATGPQAAKVRETYRAVIVRAAKVYVFVMALVLLGEGFKPIVDRFVVALAPSTLYWINMLSAVVDNATLAAAEIGPHMSTEQVRSTLLGLLIAGGMLIPGNIPNIISAGKLKIRSREWARIGVPFGLIMMVIYFAILFVRL